ncbi:MAG: transporter [Gemmatimonadetes bacterium]|nr:transporter [Gemmatimonadota bacterium]
MRRITSVFLVAGLLLPTTLQGQSLSEQFEGLFTFGSCGEPLCLDVDPNFHGSHYLPGAVQGQNNLLAFLGSTIAAGIGNLPVGSATSSEIFTFVDGVPVAEQVSSGPIFAERGQTLGKGGFILGSAVSGISFNQIRGINLSDVELTFVHQNVGDAQLGVPDFEQDVIEVGTDMSLDILAVTVGATYGLTDRIDIGVVVPFVSASLSGESQARVIPASGGSLHRFGGTPDNPIFSANAQVDGSASGIGDLAARMKVNLLQTATNAFAILGEVRLPTGDEENFLGGGETVVRAMGVFSSRQGNFTPHLNAGILFRTGDVNTQGVIFNAGFDQLLSPKATLAIDVLGNFQVGEGFEFPTEVVYDVPAGQRVDLTNVPDVSDSIIDLAIGGKYAATDNLRLVGNVFVPLNSGGLRASLAWTAGVELDLR